ncbi:TetR/AcrR family transcriptional regulator [Mycobacterium sp.]|uniref:TetR/AcrR family transcriptional regulator n=1 Tax=Mycobacterium sp. TaxID=1785 RepID=UPI003F9879F0
MPAPYDTLTAKGQHTRARIIEAAAQLLLQRGIHRTTMEDIQLLANVSASQLYHYFDNKRDLLAAVIQSQTEITLANELLAGMASVQDLHRWRDAVVSAAHRLGSRAGCPLAAFGEEIRDTDPELLDLVAEGLRRLTDLVTNALDAMRRSGELHPDTDAQRLAVVAVTAYEGGLLVAQIQRDVTALQIALDSAIAIIETHRV